MSRRAKKQRLDQCQEDMKQGMKVNHGALKDDLNQEFKNAKEELTGHGLASDRSISGLEP